MVGPGDAEEGEGTPLGETLRRERLRRQMTLDELARAARVPVQHLESLEAEDFDSLPPRIYVLGYLEAVGRALDMPGGALHRGYEAALSEKRRQHRGEEAIFGLFRPQGERFHWRDWTVPILLVLAAGAYASGRWLAGRDAGPGSPAAPPPAVRPLEAPIQPLSEVERPPGEKAFTLPAAAAVLRVVVRAEAPTWVSAERDGGGREEWTMRAGETADLAARQKIVLSVGDAGAVRISCNGREYGFMGHRGEVKRDMIFAVPEK